MKLGSTHPPVAGIILVALMLLVNGCSAIRVGYNQGPFLAWWWLDGYVDFNQEQTPHAKHAIHQWFVWHRHAQLPAYADWLAAVRNHIGGPVTSAQVCQWSDELQAMIAPAFDQAAHLSATVVPHLGETQWRRLERRYAKSNAELRHDFLQPDPEDRRRASIKRTVKRIENLYGDIDETQRRLITTSIDASPFNPEAWLTERHRRQQIALLTLRRLAIESSDTAQTEAAIRELIQHTYRSDDPGYRAYQLQLATYTCDFIARMHNSTSLVQRQHAHDKLTSWETDFRTLAEDSRQKAAVAD
ncbi:MAG: DUF6279 family lipoprotein [Nitrosomonas sp.]|nr:MAG: DUF6279 family lipoprotein [Nitrosomonas sp.]